MHADSWRPELEGVNVGDELVRILPGQDLTPVAELRYEVYIREQGKLYGEADHQRCHFTDVLDATGLTLMVKRSGKCIATVRLNHFDDPDTLSAYGPFLGATPFVERWGKQVVTCTRLAISREDRRGEACRRIFEGIYRYAQEANVRFCLIYCAKQLEGLFLRYGFQPYLSDTVHPAVGPVCRPMLICEHSTHLASCGSPFARLLANPALGAESAEWYVSELSANADQLVALG